MRKADAATRASGSHYLDPEGPTVARLVEAAALRPGESVLDAGAGHGAITGALCAAVSGADGGVVLAVEQDAGLAERLKGHGWPGLRVIAGDALAVKLPARLDAVVANPPYRIVPGLLRRLLDHGFGRAVLVVPLELAERLTAPVKSEGYGKLTVQVAARAKCELLFPVPRKAFDPPPAVPSAAIRVTPKPASSAGETDWGLMDTVLEAAWDGRKRTLRHALSPLAGTLRLPPQDVSGAIAAVKGQERRFSDVSPWEYTVVTRHLAASMKARRVAGQAAKKARRRDRPQGADGDGRDGGGEGGEGGDGGEA